MEKLAFKTIESDEGINQFLDKFQNYVGVRLPFEYARNSKIVGVFLKDKLVGGYMLVTKPGFRSLLFIPDSIRRSNTFFKRNHYEMMEVNGLWLGPQIKTARLQFLVWMKLMKDVMLSRKNFILLMGDARNKNIEYIHGLTKPTLLFEGAPFLMAGDASHESVRVSYTTRWNILTNIPRYWYEYKNREQRARIHASQRAFSRSIKEFGAKVA